MTVVTVTVKFSRYIFHQGILFNYQLQVCANFAHTVFSTITPDSKMLLRCFEITMLGFFFLCVLVVEFFNPFLYLGLKQSFVRQIELILRSIDIGILW